jgi:PAS domain-containing protein
MTGPQLDYAAAFRQLPLPVLLLTPEFVIADANLAYLRTTGRSGEELLGRSFFDAFPDDPSDPNATGVRNSSASLRRVLATSEPDALEFQKYDVEVPGSPGQFARRYWSAVNAPVFGPDGGIVLIAHCLEEVTDRMRRFMSALKADAAYGGPALSAGRRRVLAVGHLFEQLGEHALHPLVSHILLGQVIAEELDR